MEEVKLLGFWASPFSYRVIWALKMKGVDYDYIEEDLSNKSRLLLGRDQVYDSNNKSKLLLQYNPVNKKIPVLVHGGKPICESMIIIEYIDEKWPHSPLLPSDPYERALARFWVQFADEKALSIFIVLRTTGEEQEKAKKESLEMLRIIEEHAIVGDKKFFGGEEIGIVDLAFGWISVWFGIIEEIVGVKLFDAHEFPRLHAWVNNFKEVPVIKENLPNRDDMLALFKGVREKNIDNISLRTIST